MITGFVKGQNLRIAQPLVVSDTIDYLEARFVFQTADWAGLSKWAHFTQGEKVFDIMLTDDKIRKEDHLNLSAGEWTVYLHGTSADGMRITTAEQKITVQKTGTLNGQPLPEIPLSAAEQIAQIAQSVRDDADAGKFNGERGPAGPTGGPGPAGPIGPQGISGVWIGSGRPPAGNKANVLINPNGSPSGDLATKEYVDKRIEEIETGGPGTTGPQGPQGEPGPIGPQGPRGEKGEPGPIGPRGLQGETGPEGPAGKDGAIGPQGPAGETGPAGADGKAGAPGPTGPSGADGKQGPPGKPGDPGKDAPTPALSIGTVQTLAPGSKATAEMTGPITDRKLNLGIPRGDKGEGDGGTGGPLKPLTFTGAVSDEYDGTAPIEAHIPTVDEILAGMPKWKWGAF